MINPMMLYYVICFYLFFVFISLWFETRSSSWTYIHIEWTPNWENSELDAEAKNNVYLHLMFVSWAKALAQCNELVQRLEVIRHRIGANCLLKSFFLLLLLLLLCESINHKTWFVLCKFWFVYRMLWQMRIHQRKNK